MTGPVKEKSQGEKKRKLKGGKGNLLHLLTASRVASTYSVGAVRPGNGPVHHPGDASLLASLGQHLAHSLTRCHAVCGCQLLLQRPLPGGAGQHRDGRAAGEHACRHVVLGARKLQPENTGGTNRIKNQNK